MKYGAKGSMTSKMALADFRNVNFTNVKFTSDYQKNKNAQAIAPIICKMSKQFGLDPVLALSQWAVESAWGTRNSGANNPFGFTVGKGKPNIFWKGASKSCKTWEELKDQRVDMSRAFRSYDTVEDGVGDYLRLIGETRIYKQVREEGIIGLRIYATASNYTKIIANMYDNFEKIFEKLIPVEVDEELEKTIVELKNPNIEIPRINYAKLLEWLQELRNYKKGVM